jgi:hypothetical protein
MTEQREDARLYIGSDTPSRLIKRAKGIRFRRYIWINKSREIWPIAGLVSSHLFFICKAILKYANNNRWEKINKLWEAQRSGKDQWGKPITQTEAMNQIDKLKEIPVEELALREYSVYTDVVNEMQKRGLDHNSDEHAMNARKDVDELKRRYGKL